MERTAADAPENPRWDELSPRELGIVQRVEIPITLPHRRIRAAVLARDGRRCVYCGTREDLTVDYVQPLSRGGELSVRNAVCACRSCNSSRGGRLSGGHNRLGEP